MSASLLSSLAGALLSLAFSYLPGLNEKFDRLGQNPDGTHDNGARKRLVMLALLALVSAGSFGLACLGWAPELGLALTCDKPGAVELLSALVMAIMANQSVYALSPQVTHERSPGAASPAQQSPV